MEDFDSPPQEDCPLESEKRVHRVYELACELLPSMVRTHNLTDPRKPGGAEPDGPTAGEKVIDAAIALAERMVRREEGGESGIKLAAGPNGDNGKKKD